jgi:hypothetical protein
MRRDACGVKTFLTPPHPDLKSGRAIVGGLKKLHAEKCEERRQEANPDTAAAKFASRAVSRRTLQPLYFSRDLIFNRRDDKNAFYAHSHSDGECGDDGGFEIVMLFKLEPLAKRRIK